NEIATDHYARLLRKRPETGIAMSGFLRENVASAYLDAAGAYAISIPLHIAVVILRQSVDPESLGGDRHIKALQALKHDIDTTATLTGLALNALPALTQKTPGQAPAHPKPPLN
ncbi:MAG: hypothetical protein H6865_05915, partial [Rhodospirillales bacterium]|nr:hypothetical protein [Rhodospirillales bacterium]